MLFRIPFLVPVQRSKFGSLALHGYDAFFDLYDRYQPLKRGKPHVRLGADDLKRLEPGLQADAVGGVTFDEWNRRRSAVRG
ncbi:MAG: hypothetical protein R3B13_29555 [Polyangiaceae bacterium]